MNDLTAPEMSVSYFKIQGRSVDLGWRGTGEQARDPLVCIQKACMV